MPIPLSLFPDLHSLLLVPSLRDYLFPNMERQEGYPRVYTFCLENVVFDLEYFDINAKTIITSTKWR